MTIHQRWFLIFLIVGTGVYGDSMRNDAHWEFKRLGTTKGMYGDHCSTPDFSQLSTV